MHVVEKSSASVVKKLIQHGSKDDVMDNIDNTPLIHSIRAKKHYITSVLVRSSRNINMMDNKGITALNYAAKTGNKNLLRKIYKKVSI